MTSGGGVVSAASTAAAPPPTLPRGDPALRATSCQETSPTAPAARRAPALKTPAPGREVTSPSAVRVAIARETVTGLTWYRVTSTLLEGSFSPLE